MSMHNSDPRCFMLIQVLSSLRHITKDHISLFIVFQRNIGGKATFIMVGNLALVWLLVVFSSIDLF